MVKNSVINRSSETISEIVDGMGEISEKLLMNMDRQIDAVISSDAGEIESLSEEHAILSSAFKTFESSLIRELEMLLDVSGPPLEPVRIDSLKMVMPEAAGKVDHWKRELSAWVAKLQDKQGQLVGLLEFALSENTRYIRAIYTMGNENDVLYSRNGNTSAVSYGAAVNREV